MDGDTEEQRMDRNMKSFLLFHYYDYYYLATSDLPFKNDSIVFWGQAAISMASIVFCFYILIGVEHFNH